ncbi:restriction endonuclease [Acinetobacter sp. R933-2]|uniref:restriction endonuclease n=1 Tax=Acinetobacter sp. R933-2 TaxID=2746728 RepID=UPI0025755AB4|nr:restriction endonuclease [Acinetobacter sp. R933-2]MDM1247086.1 restriction endonuclease [Acinetobacter sp. R933-2]
MFEVQQYQQALEQTVTFPIEVAQQILGVIEAVFGADFERVHGATDIEILIETFRVVLDGLTPAQLANGIKNMRSEKWCPTLSEFRRLCLQDDSWWTAEMAWAMALNWKKDNTKPITNLTRKTLFEVSEILTTQGQKAAYKPFIETYEFNLREAKKQNRTQLMWVRPDRTNSEEKQKEFEEKQKERSRTVSPMPANLAAQVELIYKRAGKVS